MSQTTRVFSAEFRAQVARRIQSGESVSKLQRELDIRRSILYRWRDAYRQAGVAGVSRPRGRPPGVPHPKRPQPGLSVEQILRDQVAALERKIGQQTLQLDFSGRAFKRIKGSSQPRGSAGATASTGRSGT